MSARIGVSMRLQELREVERSGTVLQKKVTEALWDMAVVLAGVMDRVLEGLDVNRSGFSAAFVSRLRHGVVRCFDSTGFLL